MNGRVARDLRRLAFARWNAMESDYKKVIHLREVYKQTKKEYKNDKKNLMLPRVAQV